MLKKITLAAFVALGAATLAGVSALPAAAEGGPREPAHGGPDQGAAGLFGARIGGAGPKGEHHGENHGGQPDPPPGRG